MSERWDVVLRVLDGPLAGQELTLRGPIVRIGSARDPEGLSLPTGYRGVEPRHAVITAYDGGRVTVGAVGAAPVRTAPHASVSWDAIDPISATQFLNPGGALLLGPVGRGVTLQFVRAVPLGTRQEGALASTASPRVSVISTRWAPAWFVGCALLLGTTGTVGVVAVAAGVGIQVFGGVEPLGIRDEGVYWEDYVVVDKATLKAQGLDNGLDDAFVAFVMAPNAEAAGDESLKLPDRWDRVFYDHVAASFAQHAAHKRAWRRFGEIADDYAFVVDAARKEGLPDVFAGIPYRESTYTSSVQSAACAKGWWQLMPEVAHRMDVPVSGCRFTDAADAVWAPTERTPPAGVMKNAVYVHDGRVCRIAECAVDGRTDLASSTTASMALLGEAFADPELRASGAAVQLAILSHNSGYDDGRFGVPKTTNILPLYRKWAAGRDSGVGFYGHHITCIDDASCAGALRFETQHYAYPIVARHLLAVCFYAKNHPEVPAFANWTRWSDGYCERVATPALADL